MNLDLYSVIMAPVITEKATLVGGEDNTVVFRVHPSANKLLIKQAVETLFSVNVRRVRTLKYLGKTRRVGRSVGRRPSWKKAYVTMQAGHSIDFFEGV